VSVSISGKKLIKLAEKDGWVIKRRATHGIALAKKFSDKTRVTVIPYTRAPLDEGTLAANWSQTNGDREKGIGRTD
jgi:hypothetical protein